MERTLIEVLPGSVGSRVSISGWIDVRRDHGKLIFLDVRDRTGTVQAVVTPKAAQALEVAQSLRPQTPVTIEGEVKERADGQKGAGRFGGIEIAAAFIQALSTAQELPFDFGAELNLDTYLDYLPLTLRRERARDIFKVQEAIIDEFRAGLRAQGFTEFQAPALVGGDAEGGAAAFKVDYYYDQKAFLATSPQLYKQITVGAFERVFTTPKVFRGEKHATTRHLSEYSSMDFEMGFIRDHTDVMAALEESIRRIVLRMDASFQDVFTRFETALPLLPEKIPSVKLREAQRVLGVDEAPDLEPEHERALCEWAAKEHGSDFIFVTHYPMSKRPFYTYEDENDRGYSKSFDLLFRGLEITTGGQRVHEYEELISRLNARGMDPAHFSFYLQAFKYGLPPHGGSATGLERITARMLNLPNVKEATYFPRDLNRIDTRLSR